MSGSGGMNPIVRRRIDQVRRRWWVVLVIATLATLSGVQLLTTNKPMYEATSTLVLASPGRSPVEDAAMAVGYASLLNEPATIARLKAARNIPKEVTVEGRMVGASPIVTVAAAATDPNVAQNAAQDVAEAFRDDINAVRQRRIDKAIQDRQAELDVLMTKPGPDGFMNPLVPVVQQQLNTLRSDSTDQLQELQLRAGVTQESPKLAFQFAARALGGLVLGVLAALGLATMSRRLSNSTELLEKTGIKPLIEVPAGGSMKQDSLREDRLRMLANMVSLQDLPKSTVVALTDTRGASAARELAAALARLSAEQGNSTVLVHTGNDAPLRTARIGFNEALADRNVVSSALQAGTVESLKIMYSGSAVTDRYPLVSRDRIAAVFDELRAEADVIVVVAPSIVDTVDTQPICAAADLTIVVVDGRNTRAGDVTAAVESLADTHAVLLGAVLVEGRKGG